MTTQSTRSVIAPLAHGILDESVQDTLHVRWIITRECDCRCEYCNQWADEPNTIYMKERLLSVAHTLLSARRPYYKFSFTGGEPTLHPHLHNLVTYLYSTEMPIDISIETNGQRPIEYYKQVLKVARPHTLQLVITAHMAHVDLVHLCLLIATVFENNQFPIVRLVLDPAHRDTFNIFHTALTQLRRTVPFALHIWPLLHDGKADSRYTSEDYSLWEKADQFFSDAEMTLPASASLPVLITQCRHKDQDGKIIVSNSDSMEADVDVSGLHCCMGMNFLCVQPDGSYTPSLCPQGIKKENLWTGNRNTVHGAGQICVCASARCLYAENDVIPKFRNRAEAETCLHKAKKRALATQAASIPLPNPVCTESATEEVIRVRLKRIKPLRVATATQPTAVGVCLQHADDISTLYESIQEKSQELFLRALKVLETGNYGYLPDCSESDITNTNKNDIVLQPCIADYVTVPLEFVLNNPGQKFALSCLNGDTATLVLHPADVANTIDSNPAPLWPGTVFPDRVSVIIPTHDNEMTIRRSLDSALVQNIDDLEIIVVDNNSHDATPTILEEYHKWYPEQIRIIRLAANRGPGLARNVGMDIATGAYIAFLDSDDAMHTHFLSRALENIQTAQADVAVFNLRRVNEDGSITTLSIEPGIYCGEDAVLHLLGYTMGGYSINNRLYTTKLLRENSIRFSEIVVHHDLLFNLDATWKASRICAINEVGYTQYIRKNAVGNRNNRNPQIDAFARTIRYLQTFFANNNLDTTSGIFLQCLHRLYKSNRLYMLQTVQTASDSDLSTVLPDALLNQFSGTSEAVRLLLMDTIPSYSRGRYVLLPEEREAFLNNEIPAIPIVPTAIALKEADAPRETVPLLSLVVMDVGHDWDLDLCLERLTFQDMSRAEVLLVCTGDASKKSELEELATAFPKFRIYCAPKNASISACCSLALEKSIASHVFLMDTTDHMSAGFVAAACELIESRQPDVILFSVVTNFGTEAVTTRRLGDGECSGLEAARHAFVEPTMRDLRGTVLRVTPMRQITWQADDIFYNETVALHLLGCSEGVITRAQVALSRMAIDPQQGGIQATRAGIQAAWAGYALLQQLAVHHNGALSAELEIFCRNHMLSALLPQYAAFWQATDKLPFPTDPSEVLRLPIAMRGLWKLCATTYQSETPTIESCSSSIVVNDLNSPPLVSIIVPIREQSEDYSCFFDALRNQALSAMEIIVLDNTSGDVTSAHLQVATKYDSRYKIVPITEKLDDATICDRGFRNASGQFMLFMNPSKKNHAEALLRGAAILQRHNKVGAVWLDSFMSGLGDVSFTPKDVLLERLQQNDTHRAWLTTGVLFRKELFEDGFKLWSTLDAPNVYLWAVYAKTHGVAELGLPTAQKQGTEQALLASAAHFAQLLKLSLCYSPDTAQGLAANTGFMQSQLLPRLKTCLAILPCEGESGLLAFSDAELCALAEANTMSRFMLDDCAALYAKQSQAPNFVTHTQLIEDATTSPLVFCGKQDSSNTTTVDISVILIVENVENTLAACLDRLVAQQGNAPFEILLIDNASKDGTLNVCREYAAAHTCIRMYRTLWKTINATLRNLAINEARGTCFVFTHVGVRFAPYALSRMVEQLHTKHDSTSLSTSLVFNHDGTPFSSLTKEIENCIRYSLESQTIWNRVISTAMWRKNEFAFMADGENDPAIALRLSLLGDNVWTSSLLTDEHAFDFVPAPICAEHQLDTSIRLLCDMAACAESIQIEEKRHVAIKLMHTYFRTEQNFALLHALHHVKTNENTPGLSEDQFKTLGKHKTGLSVLFSCYATLVKGAPTPPSGSPHNGTKRRTTRPVTPQPTSLSSTLAQAPSNAAFVQQDAYLPALPIELTAEEQEQAKTDPKLAEVKALSRSEAFDAKEYLRMYPDVAQSGMDPVMHYVYYGKEEGRKGLSLASRTLPYACQPKVSVIVPVYNNAQYLHECIDSIINQTLKEIEIIIVNDGSTDTTAVEILNEYAAKDARINLIHKKNTGYGHSMNVGMDAASGEYIGIVESDDYILPEMYLELYTITCKNKYDITKCNFTRFYGELCHREYNNAHIFKDKKFYNTKINPQNELDVFYMYNTNWNGIFNREFIAKAALKFNETPGASFQDNGFWFLTLSNATSVFCVSNHFYCLRRDNPGSSINSKEKVFCMCDEYKYIENYIKNNSHRMNKFRKMFYLKKFYNYNFTLKRIHEKYKNIFLERFSREMTIANQLGLLDKTLFSEKDWIMLQDIINNPTMFLCNSTQKHDKAKALLPHVSVIIPVYNAGKFLRQCLDSILQQSLKEIEIICVDDGSTDESVTILHEYAAKDHRIKIIRQQNCGAGAARNAGMNLIHGSYVYFLDADDYINPQLLEKVYNCAQEHSLDIVIFDAQSFDTKTEKPLPSDWLIKKQHLPKQSIFSWRDLPEQIFTFSHNVLWNKIFKTSFIASNNIKCQELPHTNDAFFMCKALLHAHRIMFLPERLINYRRNIDNSLSSSFVREKYPLIFDDFLTTLKSEIEHCGCYTLTKQSFINYSLNLIMWNLFYEVGNSFEKMLYEVKTKWIFKFDIYGKEKKYFYNAKMYDLYINTLQCVNLNKTLYSFDIFDTLLVRATATPTGVFSVMQTVLCNDISFSNIPLPLKNNFYNIRHETEFLMYKTIQNGHGNDLTIKKIYDRISDNYEVDSADIEKMIRLEIDLEERLIFEQENNIALFKKIFRNEKQCFLISDMYLPSVTIRKILCSNDPVFKNVEIYVSNEHNAKKHDGALFTKIKNTKSIPCEQWFHYGDNKRADLEMPLRQGIEAAYCAVPHLESFEKFALTSHEDNPFVQLMIGIAKNCRSYHSHNELETFGASFGGPFLLPYVWWILFDAHKKNIKRLYFVARDGFILKEIFDILNEHFKFPIAASYVYGSRHAWQFLGDSSMEQRKATYAYLRKAIDTSDGAFAFVEFSGTGKTQQHLANLLQSSCNNQYNVLTYYLHYSGEMRTKLNTAKSFVQFSMGRTPVAELLVRALHGQTDGYRFEGNDVVPILDEGEGSALKNYGYAAYIEGVLNFSRQLMKVYTRYNFDVDNSILIYLYYKYLFSDHLTDGIADILGGIPFTMNGTSTTPKEFAPRLNENDVQEIFTNKNRKFYCGCSLEISIARTPAPLRARIKKLQKE